MSPQRRKGRGGGAGKVAALPPSSAPLAIHSPPLLPIKLSRQRGKILAGILPASCKSSSSPTSTTFSTKSKSKDRPRSIATSSASSRNTLLSASGLCNTWATSKAGKCLQSTTGIPSSFSPHGIARSRRCGVTINHERTGVSVVGSTSVHARACSCTHNKKGMKSTKPSVLSQGSLHMATSCSSVSQSCRSSLQKEDLDEGLRWSTMALPEPINSIDGADWICNGSSAKQWITALSQKRLSLEGNSWPNKPFNASSPDRRHSMGSSVMSIATSFHSGCDEALDDHVDGVTILDECEKQRDIKSDVISKGVMAWQNHMDACTCQRSKILNESGKKCTGTSSQRPALKDQAFSNSHVQLSERRESLSSSISNREIVPLKFDTIEGQQMPENRPSSSTSLHQRLALLEGRVSQIASELRKTKEMLDNNNPLNSVALLSDIQGKISSIEQALTVRVNNYLSTSQQDAPMGEGLHTVHSKYEASCSDSDGSSGFIRSSMKKSLCQKGSPNVPISASRKTDRLETDQQELEDRLFPHRKLLKSRMSLHERVVESRSALHSKLEDTVPLSLSVGGTHFASLLNLPAGNERTFLQLTASEQDSYMHNLKMQSATKFDAELHPFDKMLTKNYTNLQLFEKGFMTDDSPSASHSKYSSIDGATVQNDEVCNLKIGKSHVVKMQCASGQEASYISKIGMQEIVQTEDAMKFLECDENLQIQSYDTQENFAQDDELEVDSDKLQANKLHLISKRVATAGWYACDGEAIVLVHDNGCCSFYDAANMEEKAVYQCPTGYPVISWNDCWLIRAAGPDGAANKYVVAAASGSLLDAGFCSWNFDTREVVAHHSEEHFTWLDLNLSAQSSPIERSPDFRTSQSLRCSASLTGLGSHVFGSSGTNADARYSIENTSPHGESSQWWYRPCGPLMASTGSSLQQVVLYDIRDGETVMTWETKQTVLALDLNSPLQWRNRGKLTLAEEQAISIWDVNTLDAQCLHYVKLPGKRICAFHVHNADAEFSGGVRQRLISSDMEAFEGVCCTLNDMNILDFRVPSGIGLCLPTTRQEVQSVFARGDTILMGGIFGLSNKCEMQQWSARMGRPVCTYVFQPSSSLYTHHSLTQVWGSSSAVMAVNGNGLHLFKGYKEVTDAQCWFSEEVKEVKEIYDLLNPSFDYANSRILLISRDRPASWFYWPL